MRNPSADTYVAKNQRYILSITPLKNQSWINYFCYFFIYQNLIRQSQNSQKNNKNCIRKKFIVHPWDDGCTKNLLLCCLSLYNRPIAIRWTKNKKINNPKECKINTILYWRFFLLFFIFFFGLIWTNKNWCTERVGTFDFFQLIYFFSLSVFLLIDFIFYFCYQFLLL